MDIEKIETAQAPAAIGPYSQGVRAGNYYFFSGQIPIDPATGELVSGGTESQALRVMENMAAVLTGAGLTFGQVVKTTIFLTDLRDFSLVNKIYAGYFQDGVFPARATVQVAGLPKGANVEIEWIAFAG
jgi:2-iminobutanoate/2-iminopropanoate deaminase